MVLFTSKGACGQDLLADLAGLMQRASCMDYVYSISYRMAQPMQLFWIV